jgi:cullin 1
MKLIEYLTKYLQKLVTKFEAYADEKLPYFYIQEWDRYTTAAKYISHLFGYLRRWIKQEQDEGKRNIYDVYTLHLVQWRMVFFESVYAKVVDAVLKMVEKHRNGENNEYGVIRQVVDSFTSLGVDEADPTKSTLDVYRFRFERPFLEATRLFYQAESKQFLTENTVIEYMKKAEARLDEEEERVRLYLHTDAAVPLKNTCNRALITDHSNILRDKFQVLLENDREEDMARMYNLLSRIPDGLDPLLSKFETHMRKAGLAAVAKAGSDAEKLEPKYYVGAVHAQNHNDDHNDELHSTRSSDNACRELANPKDVDNTITIRESWITIGGRDLVWLPPDYKATCSALCNNMLVLGHRSGQVTFFKFPSPLANLTSQLS